jgi:hypothetical protein
MEEHDTLDPSSGRRRFRKRFLVPFVLIVVVVVVVFILVQPSLREWELRRAGREADRVVVLMHVPCQTPAEQLAIAEPQRFEIVGREKVEALLHRIHIRPSLPFMECRCLGDIVFEFTNAEAQALGRLSIHHETRLRWSRGWWGDARLRGDAYPQIVAWIEDEVGAGPWRER